MLGEVLDEIFIIGHTGCNALGKGVGSTTNEYRLCEVRRTSMTAGYDLDGMLARPQSVYDRQGRRAMRNPLKSDAECLEIVDCIKRHGTHGLKLD